MASASISQLAPPPLLTPEPADYFSPLPHPTHAPLLLPPSLPSSASSSGSVPSSSASAEGRRKQDYAFRFPRHLPSPRSPLSPSLQSAGVSDSPGRSPARTSHSPNTSTPQAEADQHPSQPQPLLPGQIPFHHPAYPNAYAPSLSLHSFLQPLSRRGFQLPPAPPPARPGAKDGKGGRPRLTLGQARSHAYSNRTGGGGSEGGSKPPTPGEELAQVGELGEPGGVGRGVGEAVPGEGQREGEKGEKGADERERERKREEREERRRRRGYTQYVPNLPSPTFRTYFPPPALASPAASAGTASSTPGGTNHPTEQERPTPAAQHEPEQAGLRVPPGVEVAPSEGGTASSSSSRGSATTHASNSTAATSLSSTSEMYSPTSSPLPQSTGSPQTSPALSTPTNATSSAPHQLGRISPCDQATTGASARRRVPHPHEPTGPNPNPIPLAELDCFGPVLPRGLWDGTALLVSAALGSGGPPAFGHARWGSFGRDGIEGGRKEDGLERPEGWGRVPSCDGVPGSGVGTPSRGSFATAGAGGFPQAQQHGRSGAGQEGSFVVPPLPGGEGRGEEEEELWPGAESVRRVRLERRERRRRLREERRAEKRAREGAVGGGKARGEEREGVRDRPLETLPGRGPSAEGVCPPAGGSPACLRGERKDDSAVNNPRNTTARPSPSRTDSTETAVPIKQTSSAAVHLLDTPRPLRTHTPVAKSKDGGRSVMTFSLPRMGGLRARKASTTTTKEHARAEFSSRTTREGQFASLEGVLFPAPAFPPTTNPPKPPSPEAARSPTPPTPRAPTPSQAASRVSSGWHQLDCSPVGKHGMGKWTGVNLAQDLGELTLADGLVRACERRLEVLGRWEGEREGSLKAGEGGEGGR